MSRPTEATRPIRFGSGGWRGVLADEITLDRARAALAGIAGWLRENGAQGPVIVARDRRFFGPVLVELAVRELGRAGFRMRRIDDPVPTPVVAHGVRRGRAALGLVFTASHNPPIDHGLKLVGPDGATLGRGDITRIEQLTAQALRHPAAVNERSATAKRRQRPVAPARPLDPRPRYLADWQRMLDTDAIAHARHTIVYDALHGTGAGVLDAGLLRAGARVETRNARIDPLFGGAAPDPVGARLEALRRAVRRDAGAGLGLATDGDADRLAVVDASGRALTDCELLGLLVDHCARTGRVRDAIALSDAAGSFVARVAEHHGLAVLRCGAGFRSLSAALLAGRASLAGDESGGFALARFGPDKDGMLAAGLITELAASAAGGVAGRLRALSRAVGPGFWRRTSLARTPTALAALARLRGTAPTTVAGSRVHAVDSGSDALRLDLRDGFVLLRASSTEKALRLFAEGPNAASAERRLRAAARWLRG